MYTEQNERNTSRGQRTSTLRFDSRRAVGFTEQTSCAKKKDKAKRGCPEVARDEKANKY